MVSILRWFWLFLVAFGLLLGTASGGYVEPTSLRAATLILGYGQGKAVVKEGAEQVVKQGMKLGSAILDATRALPAPSGGVITDASRMLPWNGGGASSFVKAGDEWLSPSFTNSTEWFHDGWRGGEAVKNAPVIIGENMGRVNSYAGKVGGETIDGWLAGRKWTPQLNDEFISTMKAQGRQIQDIGPDFTRRIDFRIDPSLPNARPPSGIYGGERQQLLDYGNYQQLYQRSGKYQGGVPGFDP